MGLIHYILVRKDLPLGVMAAMVTHAAGESAALHENFRGCVACVLEAKNESALKEAIKTFELADLQYVVVSEPSPPYDGAFMAIGVVPGERDTLSPIMKSFQCLKSLDEPEENLWGV